MASIERDSFAMAASALMHGSELPAFASEADREKARALLRSRLLTEAIKGDELDDEERDADDALPKAAE